MPSPFGAHRVPQEQRDYHATQRDKSPTSKADSIRVRSRSKPLSRLPQGGEAKTLLKQNIALETNKMPRFRGLKHP